MDGVVDANGERWASENTILGVTGCGGTVQSSVDDVGGKVRAVSSSMCLFVQGRVGKRFVQVV